MSFYGRDEHGYIEDMWHPQETYRVEKENST